MDLYEASVADLKKMKKDELVNLIINFKENNDNGKVLQKILVEIKEIKDDIKKTDDLSEKLIKAEKTIEKLEKDHHRLEQYIRRNNVEICGIPSSVNDNELEKKVIDIFNELPLTINPSEVEACHRLNGKDKKVIVRFTNRRNVENLLLHKYNNIDVKKLGFKSDTKIYFNDNMCPYYRFLWAKCLELKKSKAIRHMSFVNGTIKVREGDNSPKIRIETFENLTDMFPNFIFKKKE